MADKKTQKLLKIDTSDKPEKVKFVVKPGQKFGAERLGQGREVELTVVEALPFADLLEPADRGYVLPTQENLADLGVEQVANPSSNTTDRTIMTPKQRAETSQTPVVVTQPVQVTAPPERTSTKKKEE